jgi:hypothetical protein
VKLPPELNRALIGTYRAWDRLERDQFQSSVIDFDLAEADEVPDLADRQAVVAELTRLDAALGPPDHEEIALVRARLRASVTYLRALESPEPLPFRQYVIDTMGIAPAAISDARIRSAELRVRALVPRGIPFSRSGLSAFKLEFETKAGENLKRQFEYFCGKWVDRLSGQIGATFEANSINVEFASEDAYWKNWISGNVAEGEPITLRINVHERHVWFQGAVEILVLHEYCGHAIQMALWHDAIRRGDMAGFFGVLTVHCPDQFLLEGLAECVAHVLPDRHTSLEKTSVLIRELQTYNLLVLNNFHITANEKGADAARVYARQRLPFTSYETIERELRDRTRHPVFRAYQYVYGPAKDAFVQALTGQRASQRWKLLRQLYRTPMTPPQVLDLLGSPAEA